MDPMRMVEVLVGLGPDVVPVEVTESDAESVWILVRHDQPRPFCSSCGTAATSKGWHRTDLVDLPCFGRRTRLGVQRRRWTCCATSWTEPSETIFPPRHRLTRRAGLWVTAQVGRHGRTVTEVAADLGCDWHTVNDAVIAYGDALLAADVDRIGSVTAVGLDETSFTRRGRYRRTEWATTICDTRQRRLLDVVPGRDTTTVIAWFRAMGDAWLARVAWACLDLSGTYRNVYDTVVPDAGLVADAFHVVRLANAALDEVRRRVQNDTLGHRGRKGDPLYRARRRLAMAEEHHTPAATHRMLSIVKAGDPNGEVRDAWLAKEAVRDLYTHRSGIDADDVDLLGHDLIDDFVSPEIRRLGRTLRRWAEPIAAWHTSGLSNAATEGANNLIKRIKRVGFGFRSFRNYRIRILLYAGRPNWQLLPDLTPTQIR